MRHIDISKLPVYKKATEVMKLDMYLGDKYALDYLVWEAFHVFETKECSLVIPLYDLHNFTNNMSKFYTVLFYPDGLDYTAVVCFFDNLNQLINDWEAVYSDVCQRQQDFEE